LNQGEEKGWAGGLGGGTKNTEPPRIVLGARKGRWLRGSSIATEHKGSFKPFATRHGTGKKKKILRKTNRPLSSINQKNGGTGDQMGMSKGNNRSRKRGEDKASGKTCFFHVSNEKGKEKGLARWEEGGGPVRKKQKNKGNLRRKT